MTRVDGIVGTISGLIDSGLLKPGERLPSVRAGALEHGVSKNTMSEVYDRLVAVGYLEAKQGSGYYVARVKRQPVEQTSPRVAEAIDLVSLLREQLVQNYAVRVGDGRPPTSWMERFELGSHLKFMKSSRGVGPEHGYGSPWGFLPLREKLALTLGERSIKASSDQILLTQGANHALDLVARQLLEPGDTALVDSPGYYPLFGKLKLGKVEIVGVQRLSDGPDPDDLARKAATFHPKVFFTQSLAHNPTGGISDPVRGFPCVADCSAVRVLHRRGRLLFADILPVSSPRLAALDQLERVIYIGTFSKTLSANLRVGYVTAAQTLVNTLCDVKMLTTVSTSDYLERIVYSVVASGQYLRHLRKLKTRIEAATEETMSALEKIGLKVSSPVGGYYIWAELPPNLDEIDLARSAAEKSIFIAPGTVFTTTRTLPTPGNAHQCRLCQQFPLHRVHGRVPELPQVNSSPLASGLRNRDRPNSSVPGQRSGPDTPGGTWWAFKVISSYASTRHGSRPMRFMREHVKAWEMIRPPWREPGLGCRWQPWPDTIG